MRTENVEIKIYNTEDLNLPENYEIKRRVIEKNSDINENIGDEFKRTLKVFEEMFDIEAEYRYGGYNNYILYITEKKQEILELRGIRLVKYLYNNYFNQLFKGKYFSLWSKKDVTHKYYKNGFPVLKSRNSKVMFSTDCVLTGVCYDMDILDPIYNFLKKPKDISLRELIQDCLESLLESVTREYEYNNSDEGILESLEDKEFTEDGKIYQI